ncbi:type IV pilus twitching motility protein PilT [Stigmatella aurantiaca]|uniref:Pilus retraction protein PilT n=1 Tax=Stigmatella aurantiaca (strain DW4/3-1) TaxID=378806 RepID=Q08PW1_STIAD|nr:type IV pilus twitching motility protein PilT [Stigmatella aurantiaca]ADO74565.1 Twitching mobility protein [Stigmatella aurantiaca DW4/3-1]EAU62522.1 pilus retraction protein PilT [Stigmatella aurantiaca DW4/3-1]
MRGGRGTAHDARVHPDREVRLLDKATLDKLLTVGVQNGASDIHFRPGDPPIYRVNGVLRPLRMDKLLPEHTREVALHLIHEEAKRNQIDSIQEHDASYGLQGVARFRVNIYRQRGTLAIILRIIPANVPTAESLGLPEVIKTIASQDRGLVLVTGATGSGKSSTLASMIDHINRNESLHILTIEDPIEFIYKNVKSSISQREIGPDTNSFAMALRAALRQDPDVILVGEMRDTETIDIALKASETGHLVLSTVHTTDASRTINRLVSVFNAEEQTMVRMRLADNLKATISQRLLPRADNKGRAVALEIMVQTKTIQEYIREDRTSEIKDVIEKGRDTYGMQSFDQHLSQLYRAGAITLETASSAATNPADFQRALEFE